ncbi:spexin isoform X2 [Neofelis nebulosa]|uniref:spexin isoform X2 n=1 Tax=Neofelis nebulosa TaxID=61452 RepID=UPI00272DC5FB|nr:spexin isoform X2 [Neofelis nebulosa]
MRRGGPGAGRGAPLHLGPESEEGPLGPAAPGKTKPKSPTTNSSRDSSSATGFLAETTRSCFYMKIRYNFQIDTLWTTWVAWSVRHLTSAQVMISRLVSSSPISNCADSSEPSASFRFCVSALPQFVLCLSKINKHFKIFFKNRDTLSM